MYINYSSEFSCAVMVIKYAPFDNLVNYSMFTRIPSLVVECLFGMHIAINFLLQASIQST